MKLKSVEVVVALLQAAVFCFAIAMTANAKAETLEIRTPSQVLRYEGDIIHADTWGRDGEVFFVGALDSVVNVQRPVINASGFEDREFGAERGEWLYRISTAAGVVNTHNACISSLTLRPNGQRIISLYCWGELE